MSKEQKPTIVRVDAIPEKIDKKEKGIFSAFKRLFLPKLKQQESMANEFLHAKVKKEHGDAEAKVEEAAKIAAEKSKIQQEELTEFCNTVDNHFMEADDDTKIKLKMAKLLETNPEIGNQLDKVNSILESLQSKRGVRVSIQDSATQTTIAEPKEEL